MKRLIIISAGKFGREVLSFARSMPECGRDWQIAGFLDDRPELLRDSAADQSLLASVEAYEPQPDDLFICPIGEPRVKKRYCELILAKGGRFTNLIHPTAQVSASARLGQGIIVAPFVFLSCDLTIGDFVTINAFVTCGHDVSVGPWSQICGHSAVNGAAVVEEGVFLGSHAVIVPSTRVGAWSYVGAGSVVLKRVAPHTKVFGMPAVPIGVMD